MQSCGQWRQGAELRGNKVLVPEAQIFPAGLKAATSTSGRNWITAPSVLPESRPDALFSLRLADRSPHHQLSHFCYEADRGSMPMADMLKKFRAYYHFIKRQQLHTKAFGVHPIRAVLVETTSEARAGKLMEGWWSILPSLALVNAPRSFGSSSLPLFTDPAESSSKQARYLDQPSLLSESVWALPDRSLHSLSDQRTPLLPQGLFDRFRAFAMLPAEANNGKSVGLTFREFLLYVLTRS